MDTVYIAALAFLIGTGGVLMAYWDDLCIWFFQQRHGALSERDAWQMHYFLEEKREFAGRWNTAQAAMYKRRSTTYYRYAVRMHERNERLARHKV